MIKVGIVSFYLLIACITGAVIAIGNGIDPIAPIRQLADARVGPILNTPKQLADKKLDAKLKWKVELGDQMESRLAIGNGVVYATVENHIHALDATTGEKKWEESLASHNLSLPVVANGLVYVGATSANIAVTVYALDAQTGRIAWQHELSGYRVEGVPQLVVADGLVYFSAGWRDYSCCAGRGSGGPISALDAETGQAVWRFEPKNEYGLSGEPTHRLSAAKGMLYFGVLYLGPDTAERQIWAVDGKTGKEVWKAPFDDNYPFIVADGALYVALDQKLLSLDAKSGQEKWRWKLDPEKESLSEPEIVKDTVYIIGNEKRELCFEGPCPSPRNHTDTLYALDKATGRETWKSDIDGGYGPTWRMTSFQEYLLYGLQDHTGDTDHWYLEAVDHKDGQFKGRFEIDDMLYGLAVTMDNSIYVGTYNGTVYALQLPN